MTDCNVSVQLVTMNSMESVCPVEVAVRLVNQKMSALSVLCMLRLSLMPIVVVAMDNIFL